MKCDELKATTAQEIVRNEKDCDYMYELLGCVKTPPTQVYLKSEADKVIAELKADYKEACDRLQTANLIKDEQLAATRRQKYKRSLAMARMCEERSARYDALQERHNLDWGREIEFYYKWYMRWLELAEQFKEVDK